MAFLCGLSEFVCIRPRPSVPIVCMFGLSVFVFCCFLFLHCLREMPNHHFDNLFIDILLSGFVTEMENIKCPFACKRAPHGKNTA